MPARWFAAACLATMAALPATAGPRHVVELFTSQGCSSCPPADALLRGLSGEADVLALGFHVDYWDRLGWPDTLGSPAFSTRQRDYAVRRGDGQVYTPQAVVDGGGHAVGSNAVAIAGLMGAPLPVEIAVDRKAGTVRIGAGKERAGSGGATLWRVDYTRTASVPIGRGENRGRTVTYVNAVRGLTPLGRWTGTPARFDLGRCGAAKGADACAVVLQADSDGRPGAILGAAD
ncbi:DUF1223 domain-containing protein [Jiella sonneratiae]|uniref:DUF1223 domain-containing protein n=1 Tax=Jiella sonneratiae TaxID=2816856 RepID=A0ABS3J1K9_9HYPH|nr:DUF1223 domain-containing protein [Jiella sonneratiae]MBO0903569.1 DUF1223 domain-containing protein [Jiella sonneratiae]